MFWFPHLVAIHVILFAPASLDYGRCVVQDQANDAVYGWGYVTNRISPERFYVKLDPKPTATAYKLTVPQWGDRSDAYLESYECARAFRNAEKK